MPVEGIPLQLDKESAQTWPRGFDPRALAAEDDPQRRPPGGHRCYSASGTVKASIRTRKLKLSMMLSFLHNIIPCDTAESRLDCCNEGAALKM